MRYCVECGTKLIVKQLDGEGLIPFCESCNVYRFPIYSTAVSMIVHSPNKDKILLIQQYGRQNNILVAGYINKGESAEEAVVREVKEEIGVTVSNLQFNKSEYFEKSNTLMINFTCVADTEDLSGMTSEVDKAQWFGIDVVKDYILHDSLAERFLLHYLERKN